MTTRGDDRDGFAVIDQVFEDAAAREAASTSIAPLRVVKPGEKAEKKPKPKEASREEILALIYDVLSTVQKDLFTDKLLYRNAYTKGRWKSVKNALKIVSSEARELSRIAREMGEGVYYPLEAVELAFAYLDQICFPEALFDIPKWDGRDRIKEMSRALILSSGSGLTPEQSEELIKDWTAKSWQRIEDPKTRNRILLLTGPQNIGKDWWIDNLTNGFDRWSNHLYIGGYDHKDLYRQLNENAILKIPEFDRTNRTDVQLIKDIVTRPETDLRKPYDADSEQRPCRGSFISSCNIQDILRDPTGSTRYIILTIDKIEFNYPNSLLDPSQILAQGKILAADNYRATPSTEDRLAAILEQLTPESIESVVCADWEEAARSLLGKVNNTVTATESRPVLIEIGRRYAIPLMRVQQILKASGYGVRTGTDRARGYLTQIDPITTF